MLLFGPVINDDTLMSKRLADLLKPLIMNSIELIRIFQLGYFGHGHIICEKILLDRKRNNFKSGSAMQYVWELRNILPNYELS